MTTKRRPRALPVVPEHVITKMLQDVPRRYKAKFRKALTGNSRAVCMEVHCIWCQGYDYDAVVHCDVRWCPLWKMRPGGRQ